MSTGPLLIGRADLIVVNGIGTRFNPQLRFTGSTDTGAFAGGHLSGSVGFADAALLADIHAVLVRIEGRLR